jgi:hypothetical protein
MPKATDFGSNIFSDCTTENIDLTLSADQKSNVDGNTWTYTFTIGSNTYTYSYTFKSITFE